LAAAFIHQGLTIVFASIFPTGVGILVRPALANRLPIQDFAAFVNTNRACFATIACCLSGLQATQPKKQNHQQNHF
jgi:hypothetical protein